MMNFYQINAQSDDMIYRLIETIVIIDHHDNNNQLNHNQFTALLESEYKVAAELYYRQFRIYGWYNYIHCKHTYNIRIRIV